MGVVEARGLRKRRRSGYVLDDVSFTATTGRVTALLGPNGSGKTTTVRLMTGLASGGGTCLVNGRRFVDLRHPRRHVGVSFGPQAIFEARTGRRCLELIAVRSAIPRDRVEVVLEQFGIADAADRRVGQYSLGMRQRLSLARALLGDPEFLILDEPFNGLDPPGVRWFAGWLRQMVAEGRGVILASHQLRELDGLVDDVVVLVGGVVKASGPLDEVARACGLAPPVAYAGKQPGTWLSVTTPEPERLVAALSAAGMAAFRGPGQQVWVVGEGGDQAAGGVVEAAYRAGVAVTGLVEQGVILEEVFTEVCLRDKDMAPQLSGEKRPA